MLLIRIGTVYMLEKYTFLIQLRHSILMFYINVINKAL
jgi:hypothetical protein